MSFFFHKPTTAPSFPIEPGRVRFAGGNVDMRARTGLVIPVVALLTAAYGAGCSGGSGGGSTNGSSGGGSGQGSETCIWLLPIGTANCADSSACCQAEERLRTIGKNSGEGGRAPCRDLVARRPSHF